MNNSSQNYVEKFLDNSFYFKYYAYDINTSQSILKDHKILFNFFKIGEFSYGMRLQGKSKVLEIKLNSSKPAQLTLD